MRIAMSSGHGSKISGAVDVLHEHKEAVRVVDKTAEFLRAAGVEVVTFEDTVSTSQDANLKRIVDWHNSQGAHDLDLSIHFNSTSGGTTSKPIGTECWYYSQARLANEVALRMSSASGLIDRRGKKSTSLYFLKNCRAPALLDEVCFVNSREDAALYERSFDPLCEALASAVAGTSVTPPTPEPIPPPSTDRPMVQKGDKGPYVIDLQTKLGVLIADGDFGSITDTWVRAFQAACGLTIDGKVGNITWGQVDDLQARVANGEQPLPTGLADQIYTMAQSSEIADYSWPGRGVPPQGYIAGMALSFAYAMQSYMGDSDAADVMAMAQVSPDKDALAWYEQEFARLGMTNKTSGIDTLRHLFVMMIGLGPRESSGKYCEGRDMSASNVQSDTAEAGLFQTSWNIRSASSAIGPLLPQFWSNPNGFLSVFKEGLSPTANNLNSYGSGDGVRYQFLSRFCPLFHCMVTGVGMRTARAHWGPINQRAVTLKKEADDLLIEVQKLVEGVA